MVNEDFNFDDFLNNEDFKKFMKSIDFSEFIDKETGELDYDKINDESLRMVKDLFNNKIDKIEDLDMYTNLNSSSSKNVGFKQDLSSDESNMVFNDMVKTHNLKRKAELIPNEEVGDIIYEEWTNTDKTIMLKRWVSVEDAIEYGLLSKEETKELYTIQMNNFVESEEYEKAAIVRDLIANL